MSMSDTIADMLTRIRNAYQANHKKVKIPYSKVKLGIGQVLKKEGYIKELKVEDGEKSKVIEIGFKEKKFGKSVIHEIKRISKPGRRVYIKCDEIEKFKGGLGISIISTSKGILSDRIARNEGVGGELLCKVW